MIVTTRLLYNVQYPVPYLSRLQRICPLQYCGITIQSLPPKGLIVTPPVREPPDTVFSRHFAAPTFKDTSNPASPIRDDGSPRRRAVVTTGRGHLPPTTPPRLQRAETPRRKKKGLEREDNRHLTSMDSGLEAFSHNPTDGSFAPLSFQTSANTNYLR